MNKSVSRNIYNNMKQIFWNKILITIIAAIIIGIQYEYLGWRIAEIHIDGVEFPGLMDLNVLLGGLKTAISSLFFGLFTLIFSLMFKRFRKNYPENTHKPVIVGVMVFYLLMGITIVQGFIG